MKKIRMSLAAIALMVSVSIAYAGHARSGEPDCFKDGVNQGPHVNHVDAGCTGLLRACCYTDTGIYGFPI